jgi:hypothetical protein
MIETHTIRLRGPWVCEINGQPTRIQIPVKTRVVVGDDFSGRLLCRRRFGCPTCLDPHERVWLVIEQPARTGEAALNGQPLGAFRREGDPTEFDITGRIRERNLLLLDFTDGRWERGSDNELLFKDVRLEIRG